MSERKSPKLDPFWTEDISLGEGTFYQNRYPLRFAFLQSSERYYHQQGQLVLRESSGTRLAFSAEPYILLPDVIIRVHRYDEPRDGVMGETEAVLVEEGRRETVGGAHAWFYPARDKVLVIGECFVEETHRLTNPVEDENLHSLWNGFEQTILGRSHGVKRVYATWEDHYARPAWKRFLEQHGYQQTSPALFEKGIVAVHH